jgi:Acetyltransferase (GNAT) domain
MKADAFEVGLCATEAEMADYLYVSPAFNAWQAKVQGKRLQSFGIFRKDTKQLYAKLTLAGQGRAWSAPVTGAFGGPVLHRSVPVGALDALLGEAVRWLKEEADAETCLIRLPPASFPDPTSPLMQNVLFRAGWILDQVDINYHFPVVDAPTFQAQLGATKRQETRRLKGTGASFCVIPHDQAEKVYAVIAGNRAARGYPMTMTWDALSALADAFPTHVHFFGVTRGEDFLAGAICLQLTPSYLYVFYWGEDPNFRREMPVLTLVDGIMDHCYKAGFATLDIGVSTERSTPNEGLIAFKTGLGFQPSAKLTFRYEFK